jgi:hypothetical protein
MFLGFQGFFTRRPRVPDYSNVADLSVYSVSKSLEMPNDAICRGRGSCPVVCENSVLATDAQRLSESVGNLIVCIILADVLN